MSTQTMDVQYDDGSAALTVAVDDINRIRVERGTPVTVPVEVGEQLVLQGWHEASKSSKKSSTKAAESKDSADANTTTADTPKENN